MKKSAICFALSMPFLCVALLSFSFFTHAQNRSCSTMDNLQLLQQQDAQLVTKMEEINRYTQQWLSTKQSAGGSRSVITIPVVVHIVYNSLAQNISDEQVQSQIDALNEDFRRLNDDAGNTLPQFKDVAADCGIEFCLSSVDPQGNATNGITRTFTNAISFGIDNKVKSSATGGADAWPAGSYLNIWVCDLSNLLGYAQFPGGPAATDGIVIDYRAFGTTGTASFPFHLGRTATHEIGHWLNVRHIWGDGDCSVDDGISDTPVSDGPNYGCALNHVSCGSVDMVQNFMDYSNDACMNLFTEGQKNEMQSLFAPGGFRHSLLSSIGCGGTLPPPPPPAACAEIAELHVNDIQQTSAKLSWSPTTDAINYNVRFKNASFSAWATITIPFTSLNVSGLLPSAQYEFQVQPVCADTFGSYTTTYYFTTGSPSCPDTLEPNELIMEAKYLQTNATHQAQISSVIDNDWYRFGTSSSKRNIRINLANLPADLNVALYSSRGKKLAESENVGNAEEVIIYNGGYLGSYYVRVYGNLGAYNSTSCYDLSVELSVFPYRKDLIARNAESVSTLKVYPNPVREFFMLEFSAEKTADLVCNIFDMKGAAVKRFSESAQEGLNSIRVSTGELSPGIYLLHVNDGTRNFSEKFVVE